jgi:hypothetical protein
MTISASVRAVLARIIDYADGVAATINGLFTGRYSGIRDWFEDRRAQRAEQKRQFAASLARLRERDGRGSTGHRRPGR